MAGAPFTSLFVTLLIRSGTLTIVAPAIGDGANDQATHRPLPVLPSATSARTQTAEPSPVVTPALRLSSLPGPPPPSALPQAEDEMASPRTVEPSEESTATYPVSPPTVEVAPEFITHVVLPGETIEEISARYRVSLEEIMALNVMPLEGALPESGQRLQVPTGRGDLGRQMLVIRIREGETWASVAHHLKVSEKMLRRWSPKIRGALGGGDTVRCWLERDELRALREHRFARGELSSPPTTGERREAAMLMTEAVGVGVRERDVLHAQGDSSSNAISAHQSESVGRTNRGRLVRGVSLPDGDPAFMLVRPSEAWATDYVANTLVSAFHRFQAKSRYRRPIAVASVSRERGGKLKPHRSHQSGRDADIRLPVKDRSRPATYKASHRAEIDWDVAWILVRELLRTNSVKYVFLDRSGQRMLYRAAKRAGMTEEQTSTWFQYSPKGDRIRAIIRHADGHIGHIHVRFRCALHDTRCEDR